MGRPKHYTPEVINFIRACVKEGMNTRQTLTAIQNQFQIPFSRYAMMQTANKHKILFRAENYLQDNILDEFLKQKKVEKFLLKESKKIKPFSEMPPLILLRDRLIEEFGRSAKTTQIRLFCHLNNINLQEKKTEAKFRDRDFNKKAYQEYEDQHG